VFSDPNDLFQIKNYKAAKIERCDFVNSVCFERMLVSGSGQVALNLIVDMSFYFFADAFCGAALLYPVFYSLIKNRNFSSG
jgi:hypothetical protein